LNPPAKVSASAGWMISRTTGEQQSVSRGSSVRVGIAVVGTKPSWHTLTNVDGIRLHLITSTVVNAKDMS
jgi:hypothetical protein